MDPLPIKAVSYFFGILKYIRAPGKFLTSYRILAWSKLLYIHHDPEYKIPLNQFFKIGSFLIHQLPESEVKASKLIKILFFNNSESILVCYWPKIHKSLSCWGGNSYGLIIAKSYIFEENKLHILQKYFSRNELQDISLSWSGHHC